MKSNDLNRPFLPNLNILRGVAGMLVSSVFMLIFVGKSLAQAPTCDPNVPYELIDLRGNPDSSWHSAHTVRYGQCCAVSSPDRCLSYEILLDPNAAGVIMRSDEGALPPGSYFYQINCGPMLFLDSVICLSGPGPHYVTFCKPGGNANVYGIQSVGKPTFPQDDTTRVGCYTTLTTYGLDTSTVVWNSIFPGAPGQYNDYLSDTANITRVNFTPDALSPSYIEYQICGQPSADECGYTLYTCDTVGIWVYPALGVTVSPNPANYCASSGGMTLTANPTGGDSAYTFVWLNPLGDTISTADTAFATTGGDYVVFLNDGLASSTCGAINHTVTVNVTPDPIVVAGPDTLVCPVNPEIDLNGSITNAPGGVWSGGLGTFYTGPTDLDPTYTPTPAEISAGSVSLILTSQSAGACPDISDTIVVTFGDTLLADIAPATIQCHNDSATLTVSVLQGNGSYTYHWGTGETGTSIFVPHGAHCVTVTDVLGCEAVACEVLVNPAILEANASATDATTIGGSDGSVIANPTGGAGGYTYLWSTGHTTQGVNGLPLGIYGVSVTDANGCVAFASAVVNDPRCFGFSATAVGDDVDCFGSKEGIIFVNSVTGGTGPFGYFWLTNPIQQNDTAFNVGAGAYSVIVLDSATGCSHQTSVVVNEPPKLENFMTHTDNTIIGGTAGTATANPSGGTGPYTYTWSNGQTTQTAVNLAAQVYSVTIHDSHNCIYVDSVQISEPPCQDLDIEFIHSDISCNGLTDGSITANPSGGSPAYSYEWSTGATTQIISSLPAGPYTVTVTDSEFCTNFATISITTPSPLGLAFIPVDVSCFGGTNGSVDLTVTGGTTPYEFQWSNFSTSEDIFQLLAGTYSVTVTDANGCKAFGTRVVNQPPVLALNATVTAVTCAGGTNGAVDITASGGVGGFLYAWSNGSATEDISSLPASTYYVTLTDGNGCKLTKPYGVVQPDTVKIDSYLVACPDPLTGNADITAFISGGNGRPWQLSSDNGGTFGAPGDTIATTAAGATYQLVAQDFKGCPSLPVAVAVNPVVEFTSVNFALCHPIGATTTLLSVTATGGAGSPYELSIDGGSTYGPAGDLDTVIAVGTSYTLTLRDSLGCISIDTTIAVPSTLALSLSSPTFNCGFNVSCNGATDGEIGTIVSGGTPTITYLWSTGATTSSVTGLAAGEYFVTVTDDNGCTRIDSITLTEPVLLAASTSSPTFNCGTNVSCNGANDGQATANQSGGCAPYTYLWSNGQTTSTATGLAAGSYTVTVTDANNCTATSTVLLSEPTLVTASVASPTFNCGYNVSSDIATDGSATATPAGGCAPYSFLWSNGQTAATAINLGAGTYTVTVTDNNGCDTTASITLTAPSTFAIAASANTFNCGYNVSCNGATDGQATVVPSGGCAPYVFLWSNGQTTATATGLSAGSYTVTVTDDNGNSLDTTLVLTQPVLLTATTDADTFNCGYNVSCNGATDGQATADQAGGCAPYTYLWSNGQTTQTATNLAAGSYTVTVTDNNGCTATSTILLDEPVLLTATTDADTFNCGYNVSCNGATDGQATAGQAGGCAPYTYLWSNGQTTQTATNLAAGSYTVTVTDNNGCTATSTILLDEPVLLTATTDADTFNCGYNVSCNGATDGQATAGQAGGCAPYTYLWSNGQTTQTATNLAAGSYTVTVTDNNGCTATSTILLDEPVLLTVTTDADTFNCGYNVSCNGATDGQATAGQAGGCAPYTYLWSNGQTTQTATNLAAGSYTVTVTDNNGCTATSTILLDEPVLLTATTDADTFNCGYNVSCNGATDGQATADQAGGCAPYTYLWSNGQTTQTATNLAAGSYTVTVTDNNGCTATSTILLDEPVLLTATTDADTFNCGYNVSCNGATDGQATAGQAGGCAPYTYLWSNGQTTQTATNLAAGSYTVTVTDNNGCTATSTILLDEPVLLTATTDADTFNCGYNVSCNGATDGQATAGQAGGCAPYTYLWSNGQTTQTATNLAAGSYTVTVTDNNGCTATSTILLDEPVLLTATTDADTFNCGYNVSCNGATDGQATAGQAGGCAPYTYLWSNGQTTQTATNLAAGSYTVTVTDNNGCTATSTILLDEPVLLTATTDADTFNCGYNVSCNGATDGQATAGQAGGCAPYTYLWSNGQTTQTATNLAAGSYTVTVTDNNGCTATSTILLDEPVLLTATTDADTFNCGYNVSCNGATDGQATAGQAGGCAPYTYLWSNGQTTQTATNLAAGSYTVTVTDNNGCTATSTILLDEPVLLTATTDADTFNCGYNVSCNGATDGQATAGQAGGCAPYTYLWSNGQTTQTATNLAAGSYTVTVTDNNGCTATSTILLDEPVLLTTSTTLLTYNCGYNTSSADSSDGEATTTPAGGCAPYTYLWSNGQSSSTAVNLAAGTYFVTVTDNNGCSAVDSAVVVPPTPFMISTTVSNYACGTNVSCNGANDGSITVTPSGGCSPFTFLWTTGDTVGTISGLVAGTYSVTVTDNNGDIHDTTVVILEPAVLATTDSISVFAGGWNISCAGANDGTIALNTTGGASCLAYQFTWSGPGGFSSANDTLSGLFAGTYAVTITDANGCSLTDSVVLNEPALLEDTLTSPTFNGGWNISCAGANDGAIYLSTTGGTPAYGYVWSTGATTDTLTGLSAGTYFVTISDLNGCSTVDSITLSEPPLLALTLTSPTFNGGWNIRCNGGLTGSIDLEVTGGTQTYTYLWSNGSTDQDILLLSAGTYTVTVTDANGCSIVDSITLTEPEPLEGQMTVSSYLGGWNVSCNGAEDGSVDLTVSGGTAPYGYLWSNFSTNEDLNNVGAGLYIVGVTDANGCILADTITLTEPEPIQTTATVIDASCNGQSSGSINATTTGGTQPYTFYWSNGEKTEDLNNVPAGTYTLLVTDTNNCTLTTTWTVQEAADIVITAVVNNLTCFGTNDGNINLGVTGGTTPYIYLWSNGESTEDISGLVPGNYDVLVVDGQGCMDSALYTITEPNEVMANAGTDSSTCSTGLELWGNQPDSLQTGVWTLISGAATISQPNAYNSLVTDLGVGVNSFVWTLTENNCQDSDTVSIVLGDETTCAPLPLEMPTGYTPNGDGANDYFVVHGIDRYPDNVLIIFNRWGNKVYEMKNYQNQWNGDNSNGQRLPDGTYFAILTINDGEIVLHGYVDMRR